MKVEDVHPVQAVHTAHGGNIREIAESAGLNPGDILDASANLNPLGPPSWLDAAFNEGRRESSRYPDPDYRRLRQAAAKSLGTAPESLVFGNGADELMFAVARALRDRLGSSPDHFITEPCYASYREAAESAGSAAIGLDYVPTPDTIPPALKPGSVVWIAAPNNPTGLMPSNYPDCVRELAESRPESIFIVDEAFIDFVDSAAPRKSEGLPLKYSNIIILRSMTKFWCVPGLRAGYAICAPVVAASIRRHLPNWPLNSVAEAFAYRAFTDSDAANRKTLTQRLVRSESACIGESLGAIRNLKLFPSSANFYLLEASDTPGSGDIAAELLKRGIAARRCSNFAGLDSRHVRLAVRTPEENSRILAAFRDIFPQPGEIKHNTCRKPAARAKALMVQGCSSSAGKSLISAALCRIFRNEGVDVAPYKAQNMSLNSAVTIDGLEIGRAQAVQAAACGLDADARMNPVLLKPESDRGSQIILMGKPYARYQAKEYYANHELMKATAREAYDSLASEHELVILEGAGSPAEINLKPRDFVNMGAALHAGAKILLVGDIDRGGVFASFIGHASTFSPPELELFAGFIVNKFRGDPALLGDAFAMTRDRTGYPVLGCVPMLSNLNIPDEDEPVIKAGGNRDSPIRIAVPRLPRVSNFTDIDAFAQDADVSVTAVKTGAEFAEGRFDAVIIPGTKSTVADLDWLKQTGLAAAIQDFAARGGFVAGICGGYQMMGEKILDAACVESDQAVSAGLGLLPVATEFRKDKTLIKTEAVWTETRTLVRGYEIHHGTTGPLEAASIKAVFAGMDGRPLGYGDSQVWGTYLHGVFDADDFRSHYLNLIRARKGLPEKPPTRTPDLDSRLDILAEAVKSSIDMDAIRKAAGF